MSKAFDVFLPQRKFLIVFLLAAFAVVTSLSSRALAMNAFGGGTTQPSLQPPLSLPVFPSDNWWNLDIREWPVDPNSSNFIAFINNGGVRRLHPDFGGSDGTQYGIYGIPYIVVTGVTNSDLQAVQFLYWDESDGVDLATGVSVPFYPIPPQAITQPRWIEGGAPGNVDLRSTQDRHMVIVDRDRNYLYELYNVYYDTNRAQWNAGSGAFFDMNTNNRRPDTWTSADAAGLAMLPGLVRYDEVSDVTKQDIGHAFRVTVRATNGYVYPASHRAGSTAGALPMGARLRLKASVDVTQRTSDPTLQKIFRAMQKYGLIVADNGSDLYITGTYDARWNNDILNPAFSALTANDFEVIQLGYNPSTAGSVALNSLTLTPASVIGGQSATGVVGLTGPAPTSGAVVNLASVNSAAVVPSNVTVAAGASSASFPITTASVSATMFGNISASYAGVTKTASLTVQPVPSPALSSLTLNPSSVRGGASATGTVTLTAPAPVGGIVIALTSSNPTKASLPATVAVNAGAAAATFPITTLVVSKNTAVTIRASYGGVTKSATLTIQRRRR
jgi:hypothetical protein